MNKADLVKYVSSKTGLSQSASGVAINSVFQCIAEAIKKGETVRLGGFGSFRVKQRKARNGRNPKTGNVIKIKAKKVPEFKPSIVLKSMVSRQSD